MDTSNPTPVADQPVVPPVSMMSVQKQKQASWGAIVIIVLILTMVVVGALYALGKRVAGTQVVPVTSSQY